MIRRRSVVRRQVSSCSDRIRQLLQLFRSGSETLGRKDRDELLGLLGRLWCRFRNGSSNCGDVRKHEVLQGDNPVLEGCAQSSSPRDEGNAGSYADAPEIIAARIFAYRKKQAAR
jgi:hypothetical protein